LERNGILIIEWPEIGEVYLPEERISVTFSKVKEKGEIVITERLIRVTVPKKRDLSSLI